MIFINLINQNIDCKKDCYCNHQLNGKCVCEPCKTNDCCPPNRFCDKKTKICMKGECNKNKPCPYGWCCSSNHECIPPHNPIHCTSSDDCRLHYQKTNCQPEDDTCMGSGICRPNKCRDDDDCYHGYFCFIK